MVRLLTEGSIEEHILAVAEQKRKFADSSITGGGDRGSTSVKISQLCAREVLACA